MLNFGARFSGLKQYWNDCKRDTREKCDCTLPTLKKQFPKSLRGACPIGNLRRYMARSFRHMAVLRAIGRHGDFSQFPSLDRQYKSHRDSMRVGRDLDAPNKRTREAWGGVASARRTPLYPSARAPEEPTRAASSAGEAST